MDAPDRDQLFICYAHKDGKRFDELQTYLKPLSQHHRVHIWSDKRIDAGKDWQEEIASAIAKSKIALLLVSPDFLVSEFIAKKELPKIFEREKKAELTVLWVLVSECLYEYTPIHKYQAAHNVSRPLDILPKGRRNQVWKRICQRISKTMETSFGNVGNLQQPKPKKVKPEVPLASPQKPSAAKKAEAARKQEPTIEIVSPTVPTKEPTLGDKDIITLPGGVTLTMLWVPPGTFLMGSPDTEEERRENETQHPVALTKGFWLGQTAVTQAQWRAVMENNPSRFKGDQLPVDSVFWNDCQTYIKKLNEEIVGGGFRLPTEAEWEYACRAGTSTPFSFGETITSEQVNFRGDRPYAGGQQSEYRACTVAVGTLPANPWGFCEMYGNVWEWCGDWYSPYAAGRQRDPVGAASGRSRVLRGGSWDRDGRDCRSAIRVWLRPGYRGHFIGFRLARGQKASGAGK